MRVESEVMRVESGVMRVESGEWSYGRVRSAHR